MDAAVLIDAVVRQTNGRRTVRYGLWMRTLIALLVVAAACGTDRAGGGSSETHWVACDSPSECETGFDCVEGSCMPVVGNAGGDAGGGGGPGTGGRPETGGGVGEAGAGGTLGCVPGDRGFAGAIFFNEAVPPEGQGCSALLEDFELCSSVWEAGVPTHTVLSRCVDQSWVLVEDPSDCASATVGDRDCNWPSAFTGMCCSGARYCAQFGAVCDGERWFR
jgi:hypothetical protein